MAAAATCLLSEDQFLCSICLDVFNDPVSTPCGHNFCKICITEHWRVNAPCHCPMCKEVFSLKPQLKTNIFISEMVAQFRQETNSSSSEQQAERQLKIQEIKHALDLSKKAADRDTAEGVQVFTAMLLKAVKLRRVQQYAVDVTLDPDTAHPELILSDDKKQVHHSDFKKKLPNNPERFTHSRSVLGKQSFSSGKFYFEVQVRGKTGWFVGVARKSINRKDLLYLTPEYKNWTIGLRNRNEYKAYSVSTASLSLKSQPQKVGVFVDYEEGLVSFYDVDTADLIYTFKGCRFTEKLLPFISPRKNDGGKNSAPLIITPVKQ
uniref:B30.2/SPRY domain-containing protein n=1 Tax=Sphaeramia orbicularis TaxID=375764 RepID=A0A673A475_9TELE